MALSSKTAVLTAPRSFSIIDRAVPALAPDHVVVRIAATAVCHTDLGIFKGLYANLKYPVVMGHESTGVVESVGGKVTHVKAGDPVIIIRSFPAATATYAKGTCRTCAATPACLAAKWTAR